MYRDGQGVPQDFVRAHAWLNLAAAAGQDEAAAERDALSARMDPGQIAEAQRLAAAWQGQSAAAPTAAPIASTAGALPAPAVDARPLSRAQITELQWLLAVHGYDPGPADGRDGALTRAATRQYQADAGLPADGVPTLAVLDHLHFTEPPVRNSRAVADVRTAMPGAVAVRRAERVAAAPQESLAGIYTLAAQEALAAQGYRPGPIDGVAGARTRAAILRYQADHGLPATGRVSLALVNHLRLITGGAAVTSVSTY
jgi:peptidoglycan hydrolase-like protein with peptidoglycan-binding domain